MIRRYCCFLWLLAGCAKQTDLPTPFTTDWLDDAGNSIARVERQLRTTPAPKSESVAVGLTASALIGMSLDGARRWSHTATPDALPSIAGELVVYSSAGKLVGLDARTGAERFKVDAKGYVLRGAADDGKATVASLGVPSASKSLLLVVSRSGSVRTRIETVAALGRPAARGGIAFVPWAGQYVSAIDMERGEEAGRLLTRELTSHALAVQGELFFGEKVMLHFDEKARFASTNQAVRTSLPDRLLPGQPRWLGPGAEIPTLDSGARANIRVYAAPTWTGSETRFTSDRFVATYFRAVLGFDAKNGALSWARALPSPVIGGSAAASGFALCTGDGKVSFFGAAGGAAGAIDLGSPLRACVVEASGFTFPAGEAPGPLAAQLDRTLAALDPKMAAAQAFLVSELGRLDDAGVAKTLIDLTTSSRVPPDVRQRARDLLALRRSGAEIMLAALERRYDFLSGELLPPPVGPLADALATMKEPRAAPLLARHLNDPSTELGDLEHAARALSALATPNELPQLRIFFALYRATADEPALVQAVVHVAEALVRVGGTDGRALIERAARDPLTQPSVVRALTALTTPAGQPRARAP